MEKYLKFRYNLAISESAIIRLSFQYATITIICIINTVFQNQIFQLMVDGVISVVGLSVLKIVGQEHRLELDPVQTLLLNMEEENVREIALRIRNATHKDVL